MKRARNSTKIVEFLAPSSSKSRTLGRFWLRAQAIKLLHQARLAPGGIVLLDNALFRRIVQCPDGFTDRLLRHGDVRGLDRRDRLSHLSACRRADNAVAGTIAITDAYRLFGGAGVSQRKILQ